MLKLVNSPAGLVSRMKVVWVKKKTSHLRNGIVYSRSLDIYLPTYPNKFVCVKYRTLVVVLQNNINFDAMYSAKKENEC